MTCNMVFKAFKTLPIIHTGKNGFIRAYFKIKARDAYGFFVRFLRQSVPLHILRFSLNTFLVIVSVETLKGAFIFST